MFWPWFCSCRAGSIGPATGCPATGGTATAGPSSAGGFTAAPAAACQCGCTAGISRRPYASGPNRFRGTCRTCCGSSTACCGAASSCHCGSSSTATGSGCPRGSTDAPGHRAECHGAADHGQAGSSHALGAGADRGDQDLRQGRHCHAGAGDDDEPGQQADHGVADLVCSGAVDALQECEPSPVQDRRGGLEEDDGRQPAHGLVEGFTAALGLRRGGEDGQDPAQRDRRTVGEDHDDRVDDRPEQGKRCNEQDDPGELKAHGGPGKSFQAHCLPKSVFLRGAGDSGHQPGNEDVGYPEQQADDWNRQCGGEDGSYHAHDQVLRGGAVLVPGELDEGESGSDDTGHADEDQRRLLDAVGRGPGTHGWRPDLQPPCTDEVDHLGQDLQHPSREELDELFNRAAGNALHDIPKPIHQMLGPHWM
ncbi:hypothetical protein B8W73_02755 [Arthrobacter agilis]|nr:hypothetical protein B8W73_02755 [Arthrobacter agilis]